MRAYVLIHARQGETQVAVDLLRRTRGVLAAHALSSGEDILVLLDGDGIEELDGRVADEIVLMPSISEARTSFHLGGSDAPTGSVLGEGGRNR